MAESKKKVKLVFPHEQARHAGQVKSFFGIECTADENGLFWCEIPEGRARAELRRASSTGWKFVRPETLEDLEDF